MNPPVSRWAVAPSPEEWKRSQSGQGVGAGLRALVRLTCPSFPHRWTHRHPSFHCQLPVYLSRVFSFVSPPDSTTETVL